MSADKYTAIVDKDIADLIPMFFKNRQTELETLRAALASSDLEQVRRVGHRMKGVGNSYGFAPISDLGKMFEECAKANDAAGIGAGLAEYADYLEKVKVVYE
jgi:HPt (histidine-containing phosphotransfer) domain-containing protein